MDNNIPRNTVPVLRKAHKLLGKLAKKMGNPKLRYAAQISVDSDKGDNVAVYSAMIVAPEDGLAPVTFAALTGPELLEKIEDFTKDKVSRDQIDVAYHEAQIEKNRLSTEKHQEQIDAILNPAKDESSETENESKTEE